MIMTSYVNLSIVPLGRGMIWGHNYQAINNYRSACTESPVISIIVAVMLIIVPAWDY